MKKKHQKFLKSHDFIIHKSQLRKKSFSGSHLALQRQNSIGFVLTRVQKNSRFLNSEIHAENRAENCLDLC